MPQPSKSEGARSPVEPTRRTQVARKSTGGQPPRKRVKKDDSEEESSSEDNTEKSSKPRYARKSSGAKAPKPRPESTTSGSPTSVKPLSVRKPASKSPSAPAFTSTPAPAMYCNLCGYPPHPASTSSETISDFTTICHHHFHYGCYMNWLITAPFHLRACCPRCSQLMTTQGAYWVEVESSVGACSTDITEAVESRFVAVRLAKHQILLNSLHGRNIDLASALFQGPEPVDVNRRTPEGFTALHFRAMENDVGGIEFLLSHGADRDLPSGVGLTAMEYAKQNNALDAAARLKLPN